MLYVECRKSLEGVREKNLNSLPSVKKKTLGKLSSLPSAKNNTLGKELFAECLKKYLANTHLCRVLVLEIKHSANM